MYGLIGKKLEHSFSIEIHNLFGNKNYKLYETNNLRAFLKSHKLQGVNVTIPYKTEIIPFLDNIDNIAKKTMSVNTVINKSGKLIGYNTDYYGLYETIKYKNIIVRNKDILILGNGSVSKTVIQLMQDLGAKNIVRLCRSKKSCNDYLFSDVNHFLRYNVIINTTPVGMYPNNNDDTLIDLKQFNNVEYLIDLVYNPLRTKLIIEAEKLNIKTANGLFMLVMQAKKANELFFNKKTSMNTAIKIYKKILNKQLNYVFVGLPLSGKSKYAKILSELSKKTIKDTDQLIEKQKNSTIPDIFKLEGEEVFRSYETSIVNDLYQHHSLVISTGGGLIENENSIELLKQNGIVIFLDKNPDLIAKKKIYGRPLLKDANDIIVLSERRLPLYNALSDIKITIDKDTDTHVNEIKEKIDEYISG